MDVESRLDALEAASVEVRVARLEVAQREHREAHRREHIMLEGALEKAEHVVATQQGLFVTRDMQSLALDPIRRVQERLLSVIAAVSVVSGVLGAGLSLIVQWLLGRP